MKNEQNLDEMLLHSGCAKWLPAAGFLGEPLKWVDKTIRCASLRSPLPALKMGESLRGGRGGFLQLNQRANPP